MGIVVHSCTMNSAIIRLVALVGCIALAKAVPVAVQGQGSLSTSIVSSSNPLSPSTYAPPPPPSPPGIVNTTYGFPEDESGSKAVIITPPFSYPGGPTVWSGTPDTT